MVDVNSAVHYLCIDMCTCEKAIGILQVPAMVDVNSAVHYLRTDICTCEKAIGILQVPAMGK